MVILLSEHDEVVLKIGDVDGQDDGAFHSLRDGTAKVIQLIEHNELLPHGQEHATHAERPSLVEFSLVELNYAFLVSHLLDDECGANDVNVAPMDLKVVKLPMDCYLSYLSLYLSSLDSDSDLMEHDAGDVACISSHSHRQHSVETKYDNHHPMPYPNHLMRSYMSWRPCPRSEGCLARPRWKRDRAPNL